MNITTKEERLQYMKKIFDNFSVLTINHSNSDVLSQELQKKKNMKID
jgi:hypothetical protein